MLPTKPQATKLQHRFALAKPFRMALAGVAFALIGSTVASAQEIAWDIPVQWPESNFMTQVLREYAAAVEERSDGEIVLTVQSGGALGVAGPEMLGAIRDGVFPIGEYSLAQAIGVEPAFGLERLPGLFDSYEAFAVYSAVSRPVYQRILATHNQMILLNVPWPQSHIHVAASIGSLDDLRGRRIRTYDPFGTEFYERLGANPIQMPWAEVIPALASGVLEGVHTSASSAVDGRFWEFLGYTVLLNAQTSTSALVVNIDSLEALSPEHRRILLETARDLEVGFWLASQADEAASIDVLTSNGMDVHPASEDLRAAAFEAARAIAEEFAADTPVAAEILDQYYSLRGAQ